MSDLLALLQAARAELLLPSPGCTKAMIERIDAALAEPAAKPFIWFNPGEKPPNISTSYKGEDWIPLYANPAPASEDERDHIIAQHIFALRQLLDIWDAGMPDESARQDMVEAFDAVRAVVAPQEKAS